MKVLGISLIAILPWQMSKSFAPLHNYASRKISIVSKDRSQFQLFQQNTTTIITPASTSVRPLDRFQRQASKVKELPNECIISINEKKYNLTAWANAHPGGSAVLQKFHGRDATKAFDAADHSEMAYNMLKDFEFSDIDQSGMSNSGVTSTVVSTRSIHNNKPRVLRKLFTKEDPIGVHKYLGLFCLINFLGRFFQMYFGDPAAGLGSRGYRYFSMACLLPHMLLSLSSLSFHTVPKERVVGKPMIWKEYRVHNIIFGVRSVVTSFVASLAILKGNTATIRKWAVSISCACILAANIGAGIATSKLRATEVESTTATMPYWEGCSLETQKRFKSFYAYCQFSATLACLSVANPAWPLSVLLAIQLASLLMTLVRKGLLSARGYHYGYTASLTAPYFVGFRSIFMTKSLDFPLLLVLGYFLYQARKRGVNKYALWIPVVTMRLLIGDQFIDYQVW